MALLLGYLLAQAHTHLAAASRLGCELIERLRNMEVADYLVIGWWLLAASTIPPFPILLQKLKAADRKAVGLSYLRGQATDPFKFPVLSTLLPKPAVWAFAASWIVLALSLVPLTWMGHWSRLTYLNLEFLIVGFGALMIWTGRTRKTMAARVSIALLGIAIICFVGYAIAGDLFRPPVVVEGRVTQKTERHNKGNRYEIVVNGIVYQTIRPVYLHLRVGDRINAEAGAGSGVVFSARKL